MFQLLDVRVVFLTGLASLEIGVRFEVWETQMMICVFLQWIPDTYRWNSKNRGVSPKLDGENNGKPYFLMDDLGGKPTIFGWESSVPIIDSKSAGKGCYPNTRDALLVATWILHFIHF